MRFPDRDTVRNTVERVRKEYLKGTRVILERMEDPRVLHVGNMLTKLKGQKVWEIAVWR